MVVSKNRGTPNWMVYNGKSYQNGWFGGIYHDFLKHPNIGRILLGSPITNPTCPANHRFFCRMGGTEKKQLPQYVWRCLELPKGSCLEGVNHTPILGLFFLEIVFFDVQKSHKHKSDRTLKAKSNWRVLEVFFFAQKFPTQPSLSWSGLIWKSLQGISCDIVCEEAGLRCHPEVPMFSMFSCSLGSYPASME